MLPPNIHFLLEFECYHVQLTNSTWSQDSLPRLKEAFKAGTLWCTQCHAIKRVVDVRLPKEPEVKL